MKHLIKLSFATLLLTSVVGNASAAEREPSKVNDLRYGEALYHFYQDKYFSSITDLMVAKERNPIIKQNVDPELLLGGLYLYYGLHQNASQIFSDLIKNNTNDEIQDRAWFNVGKMQYRGHLFNEANKSFVKVKDTLSSGREAERQNLLANTFLKQKDFISAFDSIKQLDSHQDWKIYAQYNAGIALIKAGKNREGTDLLNEISVLKTNDPELKALRDKTNVALGYAFIRQNQPKVSTKYLQKVRLKGPLSAKALLGIGWAYQQQKQLEKALVSWMELRDWPVIDTAVQESLLAIPYTLEKMGKNQLALQHYNFAITNYNKELHTLKSTLKSVKSGDLLSALRPTLISEESIATKYKTKLPSSISTAYLHHLLNSIDFKNIHKNYLDLIYLRKNLSKWKQQFSAYYLMLDERKKYYVKQNKTTRNDSRLKLVSVLKKKRDKLFIQVQNIKQKENILALASEDEKETLSRLSKIKRALGAKPNQSEHSEEIEKYKFFNGLMIWDIGTDFSPRYWKAKNELNQVDRALKIANMRLSSLKVSSQNAPLSFSGYKNKITAKEKTLNNLLNKITRIINLQEKIITNQALISLKQKHTQIENYHIRARYSLARLHDRLTLPETINKKIGEKK